VELAEDRENRPYLDKIYREMAEYHLAYGRDSLALVDYNRSLRATQGDGKLLAMNHRSLADYYFDRDRYTIAGAHYDSTLAQLPPNGRTYRNIKKKLDNLEDVIKYEDMAQYADSVIKLYHLPELERRAYFEDHIARMKQREEAA